MYSATNIYIVNPALSRAHFLFYSLFSQLFLSMFLLAVGKLCFVFIIPFLYPEGYCNGVRSTEFNIANPGNFDAANHKLDHWSYYSYNRKSSVCMRIR